ncbi:ligase-associated DNA damage response DEXH box helicase [Aquabacterium sp.]|uniref:ligase-associated DNA damage response DEXH box helicase n=1 Tax=Aquabacterium sp. TaxID=1872578 RepID=UPI0025C45A17|nr:ligase-associated DNA damage response DEXH box helicase [Aquabacterium sp.]
MAPSPPAVSAWLAARGWQAFDFQQCVWAAMAAGRSGLLHATTGAGKTYAVWLGALAALASAGRAGAKAPPITVIWVTPMRALAADTLAALQAPLPELAPHWTLAARTGDTSSTERARQRDRLPTVLVTTPESLSLLLTQAEAAQRLGSVRLVVVDEWHELLGNKRGVQVQLALARLRHWVPGLLTWGLSATLGDLAHACEVLVGPGRPGELHQAQLPKERQIDTLLPDQVERFPWAGHLGLAMCDAVVREIESAPTTLVFTNTRAQAELWYHALLAARPDWSGLIALHHGSLDKDVRSWVEASLKTGQLKAVVATSSLDLGVDFSPVSRVLQVGSAKGVARLLQRAGRSGHAPGQPSRLTLVPTHSLELIEAVAARRAVAAGQVESVRSPELPLDVLIQHVVSVALGGGFEPDALLAEVRGTQAYAALSDAQWQWVLDFAGRGGEALQAYPDYRRIQRGEDGRFHLPDPALVRRHRMSVGTIVSNGHIRVAFVRGAVLGHVEEDFIARLRKGDCFLFAGRLLELVRVHEMTAQVKLASGRRAAVPRWNGGKMPLSSRLADAMLAVLDEAAHTLAAQPPGATTPPGLEPELRAVWPLLALQQRWSALPRPGQLLIERLHSRDGAHLFVYPFAGRQVHLSLATLWAWRLAREAPATFSISVNDLGFELLAAEPEALPSAHELSQWRDRLLADDDLVDEVHASINATELAQRRFREIARISGLVFNGYQGEQRSARQLQASSSLFFEVFRRHDPDNLLLQQAHREVLRQEFDIDRLRSVLQGLREQTWQVRELPRFSPFAFPLMVERLRESLSTEKLQTRLERLLRELHRVADSDA